MSKPLYHPEFDHMLKQSLQVIQQHLLKLWQQNRMQECREFSALINEPLAEINKYCKMWGCKGW